MKGKTFIVFSDLHIQPDTVSFVYPVLTRIVKDILERRPDYIVCTGDLGSFLSQMHFTKDRGGFTAQQECNMVVSVLKRCFFDPIKEYQDRLKHYHRTRYKPKIVFCLGNHDAPVTSTLTEYLKGKGATVVPFRETIVLEGIAFTHYVESGISGKACFNASSSLTNSVINSVSGHSHVREVVETRDLVGNKTFAIKMPCATLHRPSWAGQGAYKWDVGWLRLATQPFHYEFMEVEDV